MGWKSPELLRRPESSSWSSAPPLCQAPCRGAAWKWSPHQRRHVSSWQRPSGPLQKQCRLPHPISLGRSSAPTAAAEKLSGARWPPAPSSSRLNIITCHYSRNQWGEMPLVHYFMWRFWRRSSPFPHRPPLHTRSSSETMTEMCRVMDMKCSCLVLFNCHFCPSLVLSPSVCWRSIFSHQWPQENKLGLFVCHEQRNRCWFHGRFFLPCYLGGDSVVQMTSVVRCATARVVRACAVLIFRKASGSEHSEMSDLDFRNFLIQLHWKRNHFWP